jgi:hypothetical protein
VSPAKPTPETDQGADAPDHGEAQRRGVSTEAKHKAEIERIADKNRKTHLAATKRREAAQKLAAKLRRGLGDS